MPENNFDNVIPPAIQRQIDRANELAKGLQSDQTPPQADPVLPQSDPQPPANTPAGATTTVVEPTLATPEPTVDWEQRFKTLQGKYNAEIPRLNGDVEAMRIQIEEMRRQQAAPPPANPAPATVEIPREDTETFGEDLITAARRWARAEVLGDIDQIRQQVAQLSANTQTAQTTAAQAQAQSRLQGTLDKMDKHPDIGGTWRRTNDDPAFMTWLQQADEFSGRIRHDLLREAFGSGDVVRTANFFRRFHSEHTAPQSPVPPAPPTPPPSAETGRPMLGDFAAPGRGPGTGPGGAPPDKRIWSQRDITAFYDDVRRGHYKHNPVDQARLEQDLFAAQSEGRIR